MLHRLVMELGSRAPAVFPCAIRHLTHARSVALTFDDGPHPRATRVILDGLQRHGARATFFQNGMNVLRHPEITRDAVALGHAIANHGFEHRSFLRLNRAEIFESLRKTEHALDAIQTDRAHLFRAPYGRYPIHRLGILRELGLRLVTWNVLPADYMPGATVAAMSAFLRRRLRPGSIVVMHDNERTAAYGSDTVEMLMDVINEKGLTVADPRAVWTAGDTSRCC